MPRARASHQATRPPFHGAQDATSYYRRMIQAISVNTALINIIVVMGKKN